MRSISAAKCIAVSAVLHSVGAVPSIVPRDLSTPEVAGWDFRGCYTDSVASRSIQGGFQASGSNTIESCTSFCGSSGFEYAGTEYGVECFCSHDMPSSANVVGLDECNMACAGDSSEACGGSNRITVYKSRSQSTPQTPPQPQPVQKTVAPAIGAFSYLGCYTDKVYARSLDKRVDVGGSLTPARCMQACAAAGFAYAGVEYSGECYCGADLLNGATPASEGCNMPCDGDSSYYCGGADRLNVYKQPQQVDARVWTNYGCYSDSVGARTLSNGIHIEPSEVTVEKCQQECRARGFTYAGLEYAQECFCDNDFRNGAFMVGYTECNMACRGNPSEMCGASNRLSVYKLEAPEEEEEEEGDTDDECVRPPLLVPVDDEDDSYEDKRVRRVRTRRRNCEKKLRK